MKLLRIISVALVAVFTLVTTNMSISNAAGTYGISCKNDAYGMQLGSDYTNVAYAYNALATKLTDGTNFSGDVYASYLIVVMAINKHMLVTIVFILVLQIQTEQQ